MTDDEPPLPDEPPDDPYEDTEPSTNAASEYDLRDSEVLVLGAALASDGEAVPRLEVAPDDFVRYPSLGMAWELILARTAAGEPVDAAWLSDAKPALLAIIYSATDYALDWASRAEHWAGLVIARAQRHRLRDALQAALDNVDDRPLAVSAKEIREAAAAAEERGQQQTLIWTRQLGRDRLDEGEDHGVQYPTPWRALNAIIGGFRPGGLYVVGARPGVGKSAIALQCAHALSQTGKVAFSTLEMSRREVMNRLLAQQCQVPYAVLSTPGRRPPDWMMDRMAIFAATDPGNIAVDDGSRRTVHEVRAHAREVARTGPLHGVVVDYLQLLSGSGGRGTPRHEQVAEMSRGLKILAGELQVPVIALSQLNRDSTKTGRMPTAADLRESGAIEQDADVIVLLHRVKDTPADERTMQVGIAKNRQGEERGTELEWQGDFVRAVDF